MDPPLGFVSTQEAAELLGVTVQQVRRLAGAGEIVRVARGLIDRQSLERYVASGGGGRTRVWTEATAWGAIALLSGHPTDWLTSTQASRIRAALRTIHKPRELTTRLRGRATVTTYAADATVEDVIRERLENPDGLGPLLIGSRAGHLDGYIANDALPRLVRILEMRPDPAGAITLRATSFDMSRVRHISEASPVLPALDAATSPDPRERAGGRARPALAPRTASTVRTPRDTRQIRPTTRGCRARNLQGK